MGGSRRRERSGSDQLEPGQVFLSADLGEPAAGTPLASDPSLPDNRAETPAPPAFDSQSLLSLLSTAILLVDSDDRLVWLNGAAENMLGISARRAAGEELPLIVPGSAAILELCDRARAEGRGFGRAISLPSPQRDPSLILAARVSLTGEGPRDPVLVELFDITQRYQLDRENTLLAQHDVSRRIIRELAHEIRNPLGGLRGAAQLLERELHDPAQREYTNVIIAEADRLAALMDRLLGPGRQPRMRLINIHEVLQRVATIVGSEWPQAEIIRDYDPSLPDLQADPDQLAQALLNIVRNAAQASDGRGTIVLRTRVLTNQLINQANFRLVAAIEVEDDGAGVAEDIAETLFYPLVSGRSTGTGLGLPLAQDLVHRHHGLIEYESVPGRTVFAVQLPIFSTDSP